MYYIGNLIEFRSLVGNVTKEDSWVTDGNYSIVRDVLWSRATTIIWLNYPFPLVLYRSISRSFKRSVTQEIIFSGNRESFKRSFFSRESIILWVVKTHSLKRGKYGELLRSKKYSDLEIIELKSQSEATCYIRGLADKNSNASQ